MIIKMCNSKQLTLFKDNICCNQMFFWPSIVSDVHMQMRFGVFVIIGLYVFLLPSGAEAKDEGAGAVCAAGSCVCTPKLIPRRVVLYVLVLLLLLLLLLL
jgi:hypothetical protein